MKETPRQRIKRLNELNGDEGYYGTHYSFVILIKKRLEEKAWKIMKDLNQGWLWSNERGVHHTIYNYLLDGLSVKEIKKKFQE